MSDNQRDRSDTTMLVFALKPIIQQALGMKFRADHGTIVRLTADEINAGKDALIAAGAWDFHIWEDRTDV